MAQSESIFPLIENASVALAELLQLLQQEQACLISNQVDQLPALVAAKQHSLTRTQEAAHTLEAWFQERGIPLQQQEIQQWLQNHMPLDLRAWEAFREQARLAAAINQSNGQLIDTRRQLVDGFMAELANEHTEHAQLYSGSGQLRGGSGPVSRGKV